ncbi:hypothetical protein H2198_000105 [Neophaeococcomyces mojaviensis]|uniref:Uncharacterized protein n=1 Tax=Neophaeococcomyces mojaviensis TaxID=3383035 RepID=A0ACC3ALC7_9EURO|nr:hypothetical protein H2198_000105 [Knufia sp. JES_112]
MYQGHFAAALLIKALAGPSVPAWPIMFGSSILDIIGGVDAFLGLDILQPDKNAGPYMYTNFIYIDWEHSALMMLVYSCVFGWIGCHIIGGFSKEAAMLGAASSIVHWLMDIVVIAPSGLTLYPHGDYHFGFGLYEKYPIGSWVAENVLTALLSCTAYRTMKQSTGADIKMALVLITMLSMLMSPWTSPLLLVAYMHEWGWLDGILGVVHMVGFGTAYIVPATLFTRIINGAITDALGDFKKT